MLGLHRPTAVCAKKNNKKIDFFYYHAFENDGLGNFSLEHKLQQTKVTKLHSVLPENDSRGNLCKQILQSSKHPLDTNSHFHILKVAKL